MLLEKAYGKLLEKILQRHRLHVWGPMGFIGLVVLLFNFGLIRWTFFPSIPFDSILVGVYLPAWRKGNKN